MTDNLIGRAHLLRCELRPLKAKEVSRNQRGELRHLEQRLNREIGKYYNAREQISYIRWLIEVDVPDRSRYAARN